jgi:hypothetical protein
LREAVFGSNRDDVKTELRNLALGSSFGPLRFPGKDCCGARSFFVEKERFWEIGSRFGPDAQKPKSSTTTQGY